MSGMEDKHKIRLSIDIQSIKNNNFTGSIYIKYSELSSLGRLDTSRDLEVCYPCRPATLQEAL